MKLGRSILRVLEVRAKPGKAELLKQKLAATSVSVVDGMPGNLGYFFGETLSSVGSDLVFIWMRQDLESIKSLFGEAWQTSYLAEGYEEIIASCSARHVEVDGSLAPAVACGKAHYRGRANEASKARP